MQPVRFHEPTRRALCAHLAAQARSVAPSARHEKWLHSAGEPPAAPTLPCGSLWGLLNNIKVLHQYTEVLSETAEGRGPHAPALHGGDDACVSGLEWMLPLLADVPSEAPTSDEGTLSEYQQHIELWRASNPGLYSHAEAAYHVHQGYIVEDPHMTRLLVSRLLPSAKEYEVGIAAAILRARPASFGEFQSHFLGWRARGVYHPLCLAAKYMPSAEQWAPQDCMHEAEDWQGLLDEFNRSSFVTAHRLADFCDRLADRSPLFCSHVCGLLDRVAVLMGVKSNGECDRVLGEMLPLLRFEADPKAPYTHSLLSWALFRRTIEGCVPPALLCPRLCGSHRDSWGYPRLDLALRGDRLVIHTGPLQWVPKASYRPLALSAGFPSDRFQDILMRMGECATAPEVAHLMLQPESLAACLAGRGPDTPGLDRALLTDRDRIIREMEPRAPDDAALASAAFSECIRGLVTHLPPVTIQTFPAPLNVLLWRIDCPSRVMLYVGSERQLDIRVHPPHTLAKTLLLDRMPSRTISGISSLLDPEPSHASLRACLAAEILGSHADFAEHPFHKASISMGVAGRGAPQRGRPPPPGGFQTSTTLAETLAVFCGPKPLKHTEVSLNESPPWDEGHIDDRYAETQRAENGTRYRDWVSMYRTFDELHRSRLAAHQIELTQLFHTHFPMGGAGALTGGEAFRWVSVASTLPAETRVLRDLGGKSALETLKRSVENRFIHDTKLLPLWDPEDTVDPAGVEIYADASALQVAVVYAPTSPDGTRRRIEMMSFRVCQ